MAGRWYWPLIGCMSLAGLAIGQSGAPSTAYLRQTTFNIPFRVDAAVEDPVEVQLFVSTDGGRTWQFASRETPATGRFAYQVPREGTYWFASRTIGRRGRPADPNGLAAELMVWVDTTQPKLDFRVRRLDRQRLEATWTALDPLLDPASLQIEYRLPDGPWQMVAVRSPTGRAPLVQYTGRVEWSVPPSAGLVDVRAAVRDRAGNVTAASERLLLRPQNLPVSAPGRAAVRDGYRPAPGRQPDRPVDRSGFPAIAGEVWNNTPAPPDGGNAPPLPAPAPRQPSFTAARSTAPPATARMTTAATAVPSATAPSATSSPSGRVEELPPPGNGRTVNARTELVSGPKSSTRSTTDPPSPPPPPSKADSDATNDARTYSRNRRFRLEYDVEAASRGDVSEVQLWITQDEGVSWRLWGKDADRQSPFDVEVESDGTYGFRMVVVATNGLASPKPEPGDAADMSVVVDTVAPIVELTGASYGRGRQAGQLVINWEARDAHLARQSVTLLYGTDQQGPWQPIARDIPSSGEYAWRPDATVPRRVWLRIEVADRAGNRTASVHRAPIDLAGLAPRARIRGVRP